MGKHRKILLRRMIIILAVIFCYFLVAAGIAFYANQLSFRIRNELDEVKEEDAVMVVYFTQFGKEKFAAVTKSGRWKCADSTEIFRGESSEQIAKERNILDIVDQMMRDRTIPYQDTNLALSEDMLNKVINMRPIHRYPKRYTGRYAEWNNKRNDDMPFYAYGVIEGVVEYSSDDRRLLFIADSDCRLYPDIDVLLMTYKLHQLEKMREEVMGKPRFRDVLRLYFGG